MRLEFKRSLDGAGNAAEDDISSGKCGSENPLLKSINFARFLFS